MIELLSNPWFLSIIFLSVIIGNIAMLKYTANMKTPNSKNKAKEEKDEKKDSE